MGLGVNGKEELLLTRDTGGTAGLEAGVMEGIVPRFTVTDFAGGEQRSDMAAQRSTGYPPHHTGCGEPTCALMGSRGPLEH